MHRSKRGPQPASCWGLSKTYQSHSLWEHLEFPDCPPTSLWGGEKGQGTCCFPFFIHQGWRAVPAGAEVFAGEMSEPASAPPRPRGRPPGGYPLVSASAALPREQGLSPKEGERSSQLGQGCPGSAARWTLSCWRKAEGGGQSALGMGPRGAWGGREAGACGTSIHGTSILLCPRFFPYLFWF